MAQHLNKRSFLTLSAATAFASSLEVSQLLAQGNGGTVIRAIVPGLVPLDRSVHIAGSFNSWSPGNPVWRMSRLPDGSFALRLPEGSRGSFEYKLTLGDWDRVEVSKNDGEVGNRYLTIKRGGQIETITVEKWKGLDIWPLPNSTAPRGVNILSADMPMPQFTARQRRVWVYLPPGYGKSGKAYPVIYMQDGQNVFDKATSFSGEWGVDETMDRLHAAGDYGAIVIAVDNGGKHRSAEYHPINPDTGKPGEADKYLAYLVDSLKPAIDATFRTKPDPANTVIMGASSGASIALYAALKRPDVFGKAGLFSTPLWLAPRLDAMARTASAARPHSKLYFCTGAKEFVGAGKPGQFAADMPAMIEGLVAGGFKKDTQVRALLLEDGQHNEAFWAREFEGAYRFLLGA